MIYFILIGFALGIFMIVNALHSNARRKKDRTVKIVCRVLQTWVDTGDLDSGGGSVLVNIKYSYKGRKYTKRGMPRSGLTFDDKLADNLAYIHVYAAEPEKLVPTGA